MTDHVLHRTLQALSDSGYASRTPPAGPAPDRADVIDLTAGEARYPLPPQVRAGLGSAVADLHLIGYSHPAGDLGLRASFRQHLAAAAPPRWQGLPDPIADAEAAAEVLVTAGGKEAVHLALRYLLGRDEAPAVLLPQPGWEPYRIWAAGYDVPVVSYNPAVLAADPSRLHSLVRHQVRPTVLVLNYPHNPTGVTIDQATMNQLVAHAAELNVAVVSDEVYRWFGAEPVSALFAPAYDSRRHLVVDSTSKWLTTAGLRVGFLVAHPDIVETLTALRGTYASGTSMVDQLLARELLSSPAAAAWLTDVRADTIRVRDDMVKYLVDLGVLVLSTGALYIWCATDLEGSDALHGAPNPTRALLTGGRGFGSPNRVRLCTARAGLDPAAAAAAVYATLRGIDA